MFRFMYAHARAVLMVTLGVCCMPAMVSFAADTTADARVAAIGAATIQSTPAIVAVPAPPVPLKASLNADEIKKLTAGEVVVRDASHLKADGKAVGKTKSFTIINAPIDRIFAEVLNPLNQPKYMPRLEKVLLEKRVGKTAYYHLFVKILIVDVDYHLILSEDYNSPELKVMSWKTDKTRENGLKDTYGFWALRPWQDGKKTLLEYDLFVDTGRMIPEFAQNFLLKRDLPDILDNIRKYMESNGKWRKD